MDLDGLQGGLVSRAFFRIPCSVALGSDRTPGMIPGGYSCREASEAHLIPLLLPLVSTALPSFEAACARKRRRVRKSHKSSIC